MDDSLLIGHIRDGDEDLWWCNSLFSITEMFSVSFVLFHVCIAFSSIVTFFVLSITINSLSHKSHNIHKVEICHHVAFLHFHFGWRASKYSIVNSDTDDTKKKEPYIFKKLLIKSERYRHAVSRTSIPVLHSVKVQHHSWWLSKVIPSI